MADRTDATTTGRSRGEAGQDAVLIPTGRKMKSYGCMRSLHRRGVHTIVASEYDRIPHAASRFCDERVHLPAFPEDVIAYKDALLAVAGRPDVETVMPVRECDAYVLAKFRDEFEETVSLAVPDLETLRAGHDRLRLAEAAAEADVPVAETHALSDVDDWERDVVVKSRYNLLAGEYVDSFPEDRLREVKDVRFLPAGERPDVEAVVDEMGHEPIVQEFVPQAEKILYCALWDDGEPLATYQHRQIRQNSWVGGGGVYRESTYSQDVEDVAYDLLSELDWHGFACIEYLRDATTDEWTFLEINPRVWQSLPEAVRAGADFPYYYWLAAQGRADEVDADYDLGASTHIAYGEVGHLLSLFRDESPFVERPSVARRVWDVAQSVVTNPRFDYLRADDPGLVLSAVRQTLSTGVTPSRSYDSGSSRQATAATTDGDTLGTTDGDVPGTTDGDVPGTTDGGEPEP